MNKSLRSVAFETIYSNKITRKAQTSAKVNPDYFEILTGILLCKDRSPTKIFVKIRPSLSEIWAKLWKNAASHSDEELFRKFLDSDPVASLGLMVSPGASYFSSKTDDLKRWWPFFVIVTTPTLSAFQEIVSPVPFVISRSFLLSSGCHPLDGVTRGCPPLPRPP